MDIAIDQLIDGCRKNDLQCQQQLYKLYYPEMIKICFRYAGDMDGAATIYNNAMLRVFKGIHTYKEQAKLGGWIKTIVINACIDFCKSKAVFSKYVPLEHAQEVAIAPEVFDHFSGKEIQQLIAGLPAATATVFNMYVYEGYTHKEIAAVLGISDGTSKWHVSEAKRLLKTTIENSLKIHLKNAAG
ncbi:MAG: RNA polymerase sigma factor [Ferruginibacter sp.]